MDTKSLMELYEKMIQGSSNTSELINPRKLATIKKDYTASQLAKIRFSDEYLQLLTNQKAFNETIEALKYFYTSENTLKPNQILSSPKFYDFLFQHLFSHSEKKLLEQMVKAEFSGKKLSNGKAESQKIYDKVKEQHSQKMGLKIGQENQQSSGKHVFMEVLDSLIWDEETVDEKKPVEKKGKRKDKISQDSEFSMGKMMSMFM